MNFTALHRAVGDPPSPISASLLDAAVALGVAESDDVDWKSELPPLKAIPQSDFPKDVAAMANSGGGVIVYGVKESEKRATGRVDVGDLSEVHERSLRSAAITAISPPIFALGIFRVGEAGDRAVVVDVPASADGPHLIFRNEYFGAPMRADADTVWMKERQIEALYRARFDDQRRASAALHDLYVEAGSGRDSDKRAWLIAVGRPRLPRVGHRLSRDDAVSILSRAEPLTLSITRSGLHPLESVDRRNPRPGLRRWVLVNNASAPWNEVWASVHHDGSVTLVAAVGAHRMSSDKCFAGNQVQSATVEFSVADVMALMRATADFTGTDEYDVRVGLEWAGGDPLILVTRDGSGQPFDGVSTPLHRYTPVDTTVRVNAPEDDFHMQVHDLAVDCVNQGGITHLQSIAVPHPSGLGDRVP